MVRYGPARMNGNFQDLLSKSQAAKLLGVSRATFDRLRVRLGLKPAILPRLKPVMFYAQDVEALATPKPGNGQLQARTKLVTLKTLKARKAKR